jgi:hypothetical protein
MIGHLYRYPHPHDPTRFIYVGQGAKRDPQHRLGKEGFGCRFKKQFPGVELPQPIRESVEVENYIELNELETIWMFQYHTWRGYEGGMNLTFPGSDDYKIMGSLGGPIGGRIGGRATNESTNGRKGNGGRIGGRVQGPIQGRKNVENGHLASIRTPENQAKGGRKNIESGHLASIRTPENCAKGGRIAGRVNGRKAVESGQLASLRTPEHQTKAGRLGGLKNVESGHLASLRTPEHQAKAGRIGGRISAHNRYHVKRNIVSPACSLCQQS